MKKHKTPKKYLCANCKEKKEVKYFMYTATEKDIPICSDYCRSNILGDFKRNEIFPVGNTSR